jgi:transcriptional regulator with XRE-family HTH domain
MPGPRPSPLKLPALPPATGRLLSRLRRRGSGDGHGAPGETEQRLDPLLRAGQTLREAREAHGLGLRQLAQSTRISTAVLEALERGWGDRLPEPAYLRTMLALLEHRLDLSAGSLQGALPQQRRDPRHQRRDSLLQRFTPGSIDVFTSWQGTVLYAGLTLGLLYALNLQQERLAAAGMLTVAPLPLAPTADEPELAAARDRLLRAHPELLPLERAARGQALGRLRAEAGGDRPDLALGMLTLRLQRPTRVELSGAAGARTSLAAIQGELALPVMPPFRLRLDPPPATADAVRWRGSPLAPSAARGGPSAPAVPSGAYRYPPAVSPAPAGVPRPKRAAISP